jgi:predicted DCC family thiol-disulfide oxidoreductase YuxK
MLLKQLDLQGGRAMDTLIPHCSESLSLTIVCDERCRVVRRLAGLLQLWDKKGTFVFVDRASQHPRAQQLMQDLDASRWSLFLIDDSGKRWHGPEAIPIILKNLPFGKIAAVFYILPGTMWLTRNIYQLVSSTRQIFSRSATA